MDDVTVGRFAKERKGSVCRGSACHYVTDLSGPYGKWSSARGEERRRGGLAAVAKV